MQRRRTTVDCLGLAVVVAAVWSAVGGTGIRPGDSYFVFDPVAQHGFLTTVVAGDACPLTGMPLAKVPVRRTSCDAGRSHCAEAAGSPGRPCSSRANSCVCFQLGQLALHTVEPPVLGDDGPARGRSAAHQPSAASRPIRPPIPPPRSA
ncbi:MAG: hypothetical protein GY838_10805 [bacterium]|nr:hypothetical protein [bacterium]